PLRMQAPTMPWSHGRRMPRRSTGPQEAWQTSSLPSGVSRNTEAASVCSLLTRLFRVVSRVSSMSSEQAKSWMMACRCASSCSGSSEEALDGGRLAAMDPRRQSTGTASLRVNGEDRKCGPAGPRQRGLVLSFRDHDSGTNQVDLPFPLPAGTCGGTATRQTGKTRAPLLVTLALLGLLGVQLFRGGAALLDTGSSPLQGQPDRATSPAASSLVDLDKVRAARLFSTPATAGQSATAAAAVPPPASLPPSG